MNKNVSFLEFCNELRGRKFVDKKGEEVPKYILYWRGYRLDHLIFNRTPFKSKNR